MRQRDALQTRDIGFVGKVTVQCAADVARVRALPLDPVGVVGIHLANQFAQAGDGVRVCRGGEFPGLLDYGAGTCTQRLKVELRQQWLELVRLCVLRDSVVLHNFLPVVLPVC